MITTSTVKSLRTALAVLIAGTAGVALAGCSLLNNLGGDSGQVQGEGTDTDVFAITVGDCLNDASAGDEVSSVPTVPCSQPHDSEAYHAFNLPDGDYPGDDAVEAAADEGCFAAFESFVGISYQESVLDFAYYFPTTSSWAQGDREILCIAYDPAGQVTGSLQGEAR